MEKRRMALNPMVCAVLRSRAAKAMVKPVPDIPGNSGTAEAVLRSLTRIQRAAVGALVEDAFERGRQSLETHIRIAY